MKALKIGLTFFFAVLQLGTFETSLTLDKAPAALMLPPRRKAGRRRPRPRCHSLLAEVVINGDRRGDGFFTENVWHDVTRATLPDWVEIAFAGTKTIDEVVVYGVQDAYQHAQRADADHDLALLGPLRLHRPSLDRRWVETVPAGSFAAITSSDARSRSPRSPTSRIRVLSERTIDGWSRLTEVEAFQSEGGIPGNIFPLVSLTSPIEGASGVAPATFTLVADATDAEGSVASVAFFANGAPIGQVLPVRSACRGPTSPPALTR